MKLKMEVIRGIAAIIAANTIRKLIVLKSVTLWPHSHSFKVSQVGAVVKNLLANSGDQRDAGSIWIRNSPWSRKLKPIPVFFLESSWT